MIDGRGRGMGGDELLSKKRRKRKPGGGGEGGYLGNDSARNTKNSHGAKKE